jgi:deoxyribose-phosphate aldolase
VDTGYQPEFPREEETPLAGATAAEPLPRYEDLAEWTSLPLADAALSEEAVFAGCKQAVELGLGGAAVRPSDVDLAKNWVSGPVRLACVTGFPGGSSTTAARLYEARDVLRRGVKDLVVTINAGKLISRKFLYLESELLQLAESCRQNEARLRVLFEPEILQQDMVLIGVRLCKRTAVDGMDLSFRKTGADFHLGVARYVLHHAKGKLQVRVHCPKLDLQAAEQLRDAGVHGAVTASAPSLMTAWKAEIARRKEELEKQRQQAAQQAKGAKADEAGASHSELPPTE